jgi:hypothetical protein
MLFGFLLLKPNGLILSSCFAFAGSLHSSFATVRVIREEEVLLALIAIPNQQTKPVTKDSRSHIARHHQTGD